MTDFEFQEMMARDRALIKWRKNIDLPRIQVIISEHKKEMGAEGERLKINALAEQVDDLQDEYDFSLLRWKWAKEGGKNKTTLALIASGISKTKKLLEKKRRTMMYLLGEEKNLKDEITQDMIDRAKEYPVENLIDADRTGMALCIFHDEQHPSMSIKKNNRAHCFSCGKKADTIDIYQRLHGVSFQEAVKALQ